MEFLLKSEMFSNVYAFENCIHLRYFQSSFCKYSPYGLQTGAQAIAQIHKIFILRNHKFGTQFSKAFFPCELYIEIYFRKWKYTQYTPVK